MPSKRREMRRISIILPGLSLCFAPCANAFAHQPSTTRPRLTKNNVDRGIGCMPATSPDTVPSPTSEAPSIDRRSFGESLLISAISALVLPKSAFANDADDGNLSYNTQSSNTNGINGSRRPFAPIDTLVPAARVRVMIDDALDIASHLTEDDGGNKRELLEKLDMLLLQPQNFMRGYQSVDVPKQPAQSYLDSYARYRSSVSLLEKPGALLVQNGEIDTWKRLKRQEKVREDADEVRAALNFYTSNLNFNPDKYTLTGSKSERSQLIRNDRLPDVKNVIASDMGLRYLLRNEVLTGLDDARAELRYQMEEMGRREGEEGVEGMELLEILQRAQASCNKWFGLIGEEDVAAAIDVVRKERAAESPTIK